MSLTGDFFRYFFAVVGGRRDPLHAYLEPLTMAERYLRWGREQGDPRDFRAGLEHLSLCSDSDAPIPNLVLRKYTLLSDLASGGVEQLLGRYEDLKRKTEKAREDLAFERANQEEIVAEFRDRVERLTKDGSLLRAREEEKKRVEAAERLRALEEQEAAAADTDELCDLYDQLASDVARFLTYFDQAAAFLPRCEKLDARTRESLSGQLRQRLDGLRNRLDAADPIPEERQSPPTPAPPNRK